MNVTEVLPKAIVLTRDDPTLSPIEVPIADILLAQGRSLDDLLEQIAGWEYTVGVHVANAECASATADRKKSELFCSLADEARAELTGKVTEKAIEQAVRGHPDYLAVCQAVLDAERSSRIANILLNAVIARREALRTISVNLRKELVV
jgi:hypothetical protein